MTYHIPDGLPSLRAGAGGSPDNGGCVIEVASYLWDGSWTDRADCVHPVMRAVAISVNDFVGDADRQKLWPLIPRLVGTASEDRHLAVSLAYFSAEYVFATVREQDREVCRKAIDATGAWLEDPSEENADAAYSTAVAAGGAARAAYAVAAYAVAAYAAAAAAAAAAAYSAAYSTANAAAAAARAANAAARAANAARLTFLTDLLDEYDRLTGRTPETIQPERWKALAEVMA